MDHFYSPIPNTAVLAREPARSRVWPGTPSDTPGIDWRAEQQVTLVREHLSRQSPFPIPAEYTGDSREYHAANDMFSRLDAWFLQAMLRHHRPARVIEVGCGWSSLVTARVNREYLSGEADVTCIEPHPPGFLADGVDGITKLLTSPVEEVGLDGFLELRRNDVLFIDTSHTVKTGGDVVFLLGEVLPRLRDGVLVHFHDIFLPFDYPQEWVLAGRGWNEQYAVRSLLTLSHGFEILIGVAWLSHSRPGLLAAALPGYPQDFPDGGGSLWLRRTERRRDAARSRRRRRVGWGRS
jgi:Methyltransferase domain